MVRLVDDKRGTFGMALFIATEACLFIMMFFAYFYIGHGHPVRWFYEEPPKLHYSLPMLAILLSSSAVLYWGE
jgi:heme/copper-type cytochrome/quinol oxidase subunit 3